MNSPPSLYAEPVVQRRLFDFLGGDSLPHATANYITHADGCRFEPDSILPTCHLRWFLDGDYDIARSLLDNKSLLAHLDIEYVNFDSPAESYLNPERTFAVQQPVIDVIEELLLSYGIRPLHTITGQGHHFVWRMEKASPAVKHLASLVPKSLTSHKSPNNADRPWLRAFSGLALVMDYLAIQIKNTSRTLCELPVEITALHVGRGTKDAREMISIDISEYGDPLWTRAIRMPFTPYLKPWRNGLARALRIENKIPRFFTIPLHEMNVTEALHVRKDVAKVAALARRACVRIPEQSQGMTNLINGYLKSPVRRFHRSYYGKGIDSNRTIAEYTDQLPPCAQHIVKNPNDLLLKPSGMRLVVRCLLAIGVAPRQIAALITGVFQDPQHTWGHHWDVYSPTMRADFYTRIFSAQIATGSDPLIDFNCVSTQEKGFCFNACGCNLAPWQTKLSNHPQEQNNE
jgi:hypothetical protein